jgi:cytochrome c oxidase cbb3-type subunit I/II
MTTQSDPSGAPTEHWHRRLIEHKAALMAVLTTVAVSIGGLVEIVPMYSLAAGPEAMPDVAPYTALELAGRDLYVREGCYNCHSQMVRPFRSETLRYGPWSRAGEYAYDRPFQLGSRRIGPDLHRLGGKYPDAWHYEHMRDPRSTSPGSIMPPYAWMLTDTYDLSDVQASVDAMVTLGVPYDAAVAADVTESVTQQADGIVASLAGQGIETARDREIIALIAYLQRLGVDGKASIAARAAAPADGGAP